MRVCEIYEALVLLGGVPLRWASVKAALAGGACGQNPRFRRVGHGVYEFARAAGRVC
jgi:hypothetical protein